jgi:hypothetical protein
MWRKALLAMVMLSLGATGAWAAAPFGNFGGLVSGGNSGNGVEPVFGWALAQTGVFAVDIVVDGAVVGRANYGRGRPTVTKEFPNYPDSAAPGFGYELDTTRFLNGMHVDLIPFGKIEFPQLDATMYGNCTPWASDPNNRIYSVVSGYALDVNVQNNETGVAYVELEMDGALLFDDGSGVLGSYNSKQGCEYLTAAAGFSNCYGLYRPDLLQIYPGLKDTPNAGFRFVLDVGDLLSDHVDGGTGLPIPAQYAPGSHQIDIRVGDVQGNVTDIGSIAVFLTCKNFTNEDSAIGMLDNPTPGLLAGGEVITSGWALDFEGVNAVLVYVDGNLYNFAFYGLARPDILLEYPSYPDAATSGWYSFIDTTQLSNGVHEVSAIVVDGNGVQTFIGKLPMTVANPIP